MLGHDGALGWNDTGSFAVHVFFVLSGWLIGSMLLDMGVADLPRFFFNRTLRIWVPYYVATALVLAASLARDTLTPQWLSLVLFKLTMVYNLFSGIEVLAGFPAAPLHGTPLLVGQCRRAVLSRRAAAPGGALALRPPADRMDGAGRRVLLRRYRLPGSFAGRAGGDRAQE
jgi:peptidoglycan/LPS O-acetylase OafA/YrhL